jgi:hypothetical protein
MFKLQLKVLRNYASYFLENAFVKTCISLVAIICDTAQLIAFRGKERMI